MLQQAESMIFTPEIEQLEEQLQKANQQMELMAKQGRYVLAETIRLNAEKIKQDLDSKRKQTVHSKHREENKEVKKFLKEDLEVFRSQWDQKMREQSEKGAALKKDLREKHQKEQEAEKCRLEKLVSCLGKESSQVLNLRKIEANLAKQHNYVEAHLVQQQIKQLTKQEEKAWEKDREEKVETELTILKNKQQLEMMALQKKIASQAWELDLEKTKAEAQLTLKHSAVKRGKLAQNKKENLMVSGELKSQIRILSPSSKSILSPSKSKLMLSSRSWKNLPTMTH